MIRSIGYVALLASWLVGQTAVADDGGWGHLTGQFQVVGEVPAPSKKTVDKDQSFCVKEGEILDENLLVDERGYLRDVFVMMLLRPDETVPVHPSYDELYQQPIVLDNIRCRFAPHALFVRTGQRLTLKNSDEVGHNCHIITFANEENVNLPSGGSVDVRLSNPDRTPGNVVCDIHKWMDAVLLVREEPYAAISTVDGTFRIENIPAGSWKFQFWHKKAGYLSRLEIDGYEVGRRGEIDITITDGQTVELGTMKIGAEHLNK